MVMSEDDDGLGGRNASKIVVLQILIPPRTTVALLLRDFGKMDSFRLTDARAVFSELAVVERHQRSVACLPLSLRDLPPRCR